MGTRRSKHNKGRKPIYKSHRLNQIAFSESPSIASAEPTSLADILSRPPKYNIAGESMWLSTRTRWSAQERQDLAILCGGGASVDKAADILGRSPSSIAWTARDMGMPLPADWRSLVSPKRSTSPKRLQLSYPYIIRERPSDSDLLKVNDLVPRAFPEHMRADICQSVMLSLYEGEITIAELEGNRNKFSWFINRWYREQRPRQEINIDWSESDDSRPYYDKAAAVWDEIKTSDLNQARRNRDVFSGYYDADQIEMVFNKEITLIHKGMAERGDLLSRDEVLTEIASGRADIRDFAGGLRSR